MKPRRDAHHPPPVSIEDPSHTQEDITPKMQLDNNNSSRDNKTFRCLFYSLLIFFFLYGLMFVIIFTFNDNSVLEFEVDSLSMKVYNSSEKSVTVDLDFTVTFKNKDERLLYFDRMQVSLEYHQDDEIISSTSLDAFLLYEKQRQLQFGMQIKDDNAHYLRNVDSIYRDNVVRFGLKAQGPFVRLRLNYRYFNKCDIKLVCDDIIVGFSPEKNSTTGSLIVSPLPCKCESECKSENYYS
ncbi:uncharacterized protein LOC104901909 isoform X2 [Beta vulgaris subsp. vulgaris]|uniref:uncharacterized protein LOC104901909 isoform X2 n=1 Tax=Beta vulgaris subsp. vulgaris TaxID=3555 RepID=UPI00203739E3|nr:uncharacterized protein LOC104901909 isoform X2 [Beta vulgaris subsp. vulgaris]